MELPFLKAGRDLLVNTTGEAVSPKVDDGDPTAKSSGDAGGSMESTGTASRVAEGRGGNREVIEEAQAAKGIRETTMPTWEVIREHELTHLPFRAWCPHCVRGRARDDMHLRHEIVGTRARISWDYMYMHETDSGEVRPEVVSGEGFPCLVAWDDVNEMPIVTMIPNKGACEIPHQERRSRRV